MSVDLEQARQIFRGPGMDTRYWIRLVKVTKTTTDKHGTVITGETLPGGEKVTAVVGHLALGSGKGAYWPVRVDDVMLCLIADGDPEIANIAIGPIVWGETELAQDAQSGPAETWYEGDPVKVKNDVSVEGTVKLGSLTADDPAVKYNELKSAVDTFIGDIPQGSTVVSLNDALKTIATAAGCPPPVVNLDIIAAKSTKVEVE